MNSSRGRDALNGRRARVAGILAAALGTVCAPAFATNYDWAVAVGTWNNGPNWNPSGEPATGDNAFIDYFFNATCHVLGSVGNPALLEIYAGDTLDLEHSGMTDGYVQVSGDVYVGDPNLVLIPTSGTLNVFGKPPLQLAGVGHLSVGANMYVMLASVVNQSGGTINLTGASSYLLVNDSSTYNLSAGVLSAPLAEVDSVLNLSASGAANFGGFTLSGTLNQTGGQLNVAATYGPYAVYGRHILQGGSLTCNGLTITGSSSALVSYQGGTLTTGAITINQGAQLHLGSGGGKVLRNTSLSIISGGVDLTDNAMIVDYTGTSPRADIASQIKNGSYNSTTGIVSGIVSSTAIANASSHKTALGYGEASTLGVSSFKGQSVDSTSVLVGYTYVGDANLDGKVNALDFNALASNYGGSPGNKIWTQGDFNYDGNVNTLDFNALASNFNATPLGSPPVLGTLGSGELGRAVPEPATIASILAAAAVARKKRMSHR